MAGDTRYRVAAINDCTRGMTRVKAQWWGRERSGRGGETGARMQMRALLDVRPLARVDTRKRKMKEARNARKKEWKIIREGGNRVDRFAKVFSYAQKRVDRLQIFSHPFEVKPLKLDGATNRAANIACKNRPHLALPIEHLMDILLLSPKQLKGRFTFAKVKYLNLIYFRVFQIYVSQACLPRQLDVRKFMHGEVRF